MTWWLSRGCMGPNAGGCDPYAPLPVPSPLLWSAPAIVVAPSIARPIVGHPGKGACCGSCAEGGSCETACRDKRAEAVVGALYVSDAELDALGSQVALMGADVDESAKSAMSTFADKVAAGAAMKACRAAGLRWDQPGSKCLQEPDLDGSSYVPVDAKLPLTDFQLSRWTPFQTRWNGYRAQTFHEPTEYDKLRTEFITLRDEWTGPLSQQTRSVVPAPLSESSGANAVPWGWIALGVGVAAVPFILPTLAGIYLAITRGRTLGLG